MNLTLICFLKVTELLSCFVDAHFTHITLSNEAQEIIADLLQIVESQVFKKKKKKSKKF
jgi:hypothetical protein